MVSPSRGIPRRMPESMGILHPGTSFGVFWSTNVARTWYRNEKYPLIPEKPGIRRGIPREGDNYVVVCIPVF
jgi:hypothetical protein